ncbi:MAG: hypothetical protein PCFJNLEI_00778 [Verrucomicrobiae bacterium]|nr:hypothetical protein [Verrucomicrobiae bacterium]
MQFLSPWMLSGLAALAVPIIIHLLQRKRVVSIPFSTLRLLKLVQAKTSRRSHVENLLLLILRCLIFALILLAAARPVIAPKTAGWWGGNVPRTVVLILDNSLSMNYRAGNQTRLEAAKKQALAILDDLQPVDDVAILTANDRAQLLIAEPTVDHTVARQVVLGIQPTQSRTDLSLALREARKIMARTQKGIRRVYLLTDNQEGAWQFDPRTVFDDSWRATGALLTIVRPDGMPALNAAVTRLTFRSALVAAGSVVRGAATVENFSAVELQDLLEIKLGEQAVAQRAVNVAPGSTVEVPVEFPLPAVTGETLRGTASLQGDNLPEDDRHYFWLAIYQPPRVVVVEGQQAGPEALHAGFYLKKALAAGGDIQPKVVSTAELDELPLEGYSAVILADAIVSDRAAVRLERLLHSGGTVAFFFGDNSSVDNLARLAFLPAKPTGQRNLPTGRLTVRALEPRHPLFLNAWDASTPFPAVPQQRLFNLEVAKDAKVLLTLGDNLPFIIAGKLGPGKTLIVNASADRSWGDLPLSPAFLPLAKQIARWSAELDRQFANYVVGDPLPPAPNLPRDEPLTVTLPNATKQPVGAGEFIVDRAEQAGFYAVTAGSGAVVQQLAVNIDPRESKLKPMDDAAVAKIVPNETVTGLDDLRLWLERKRELAPLWPAFLLLALLLFGIEAVIANVMARNRSQAAETHIATGRLNKRRLSQPFRPAEEVVK